MKPSPIARMNITKPMTQLSSRGLRNALVFVAGIGVHMLRVFFTGAFRKPRELNWVIGFVMFILAMGEGFTGYSLPDDVLSGNGLRIIDGMIKAVPLAGGWISYLLFGDEFPGTDIIPRLYVLHILLLPAILVALIGAHMVLLIVNKHTQFAGPARSNSNVVGYPMMPVYMSKMGGFLFITFGVIALIAALFTINPIWNYGPYDPSPVSAGTQPDWYIGFADGALRLIPPGWEIVFLDRTWSFNILVPLAGLGLFIVVVLSTRSSRRGSRATSASTTSPSVRATRPLAPRSAPPA